MTQSNTEKNNLPIHPSPADYQQVNNGAPMHFPVSE